LLETFKVWTSRSTIWIANRFGADMRHGLPDRSPARHSLPVISSDSTTTCAWASLSGSSPPVRVLALRLAEPADRASRHLGDCHAVFVPFVFWASAYHADRHPLALPVYPASGVRGYAANHPPDILVPAAEPALAGILDAFIHQ
jgi:hypothetical protein